jgi:predicted branched-subunit amino acid permease
MTRDTVPTHGVSLAWIAAGARASLCFAVVILTLVFVAFGAFARDLGFPLWQIVLMGFSTWAMPSMVVFVAAVAQGSGLVAAGLAVALSAVRLLPMTIAIMPQLAAERVHRAWFYVASHAVAITAYVEATLRLPAIPPERRLSFFLGLGAGLMLIASTGGVVGYFAGAFLPRPLVVGLLMLTPLYFLLSIVTAATQLSDRAALGVGFALGPVAALIEPQLDLLWAGLAGGTVGYVVGRSERRRKAAT